MVNESKEYVFLLNNNNFIVIKYDNLYMWVDIINIVYCNICV